MSDAASWVGSSDPKNDKLDLQYILATLPAVRRRLAELDCPHPQSCCSENLSGAPTFLRL
jgi:hypothetical protein